MHLSDLTLLDINLLIKHFNLVKIIDRFLISCLNRFIFNLFL